MGNASAMAPAMSAVAQVMPRAKVLETATRLVSAAVPVPITMTAAAPAVRIFICQAITKRKIAPVQGRTAMLPTSANASRNDVSSETSCGVGP